MVGLFERGIGFELSVGWGLDEERVPEGWSSWEGWLGCLDDWDHGGFDIGYGNVDLVAT